MLLLYKHKISLVCLIETKVKKENEALV